MSLEAVNARLNIYQEIIEHLTLVLPDYEHLGELEEIKQAKIMIKKIQFSAEKLKRSYFG